MADLTRFVHYACGFINFDIKTKEDLPSLLGEFVKFTDSYSKITKYYLMAHDDTDIPHIHFVFYSLSQVQLMTYFNKLRNWFVPKFTRDEYGITISKCESINGHLKYLTHTDKESVALGKKQYNLDDFVSNDDIDIIDLLIHSKKGTIDAYMLRDAVLDTNDDFELMVRLTLPVYHRYRCEIQTIKEMRSVLKLRREEERNENINNKLPF